MLTSLPPLEFLIKIMTFQALYLHYLLSLLLCEGQGYGPNFSRFSLHIAHSPHFLNTFFIFSQQFLKSKLCQNSFLPFSLHIVHTFSTPSKYFFITLSTLSWHFFSPLSQYYSIPLKTYFDAVKKQQQKRAGTEQYQAQQSLSQLPLAPSQLPTSWKLLP